MERLPDNNISDNRVIVLWFLPLCSIKIGLTNGQCHYVVHLRFDEDQPFIGRFEADYSVPHIWELHYYISASESRLESVVLEV